VGILGYGVIGRRVADAVRAQDDMEVVGVAGRPASLSLRDAQLQGYPVFVTASPRLEDAASRWCEVRGTLDDLLRQCDVLLDCTPGGVPRDYASLYQRYPERTVIVQGGENHSFGGVSFNAFANYAEAGGKKWVRVISCSSTGTTRFLFTLHQAFGLEQAFVALARRAADPAKPGKTPYNALKPTMGPSHHAPDVRTVLPGIDVFSISVDVPTTLAHVINFQADVRRALTADEVVESLDSPPRVLVGRGLRSTADLAEHFQDLGRSRRDRPEIYVWEESVFVEQQTIYATISVHMESITIPETVDCIRATLALEPDNWASVAKTDRALGIEKNEACYRRESSR
jgi:glyceraldehyde-3-phosphate dehydrogenase (NAD(P))